MKKWSSFQSFNAATSAAFEPFFVRAKNQTETRVVFNQFGQVVVAETQRLLEWTPEEQAAPEAAKQATSIESISKE